MMGMGQNRAVFFPCQSLRLNHSLRIAGGWSESFSLQCFTGYTRRFAYTRDSRDDAAR
jgi:hypothetical protein